MKKGEIYEGRVQEVLFPDKAIVVTDEGETAQVKYGIPGQKLRFRVKKKRKEKIEKFFENMSEEELDDMLERNGTNDHESEEAACFRLIKKEIERSLR